MATISVSELRAELRKALARVEAGEVLEITRDGRVTAVLAHPSVLRRRARTDAIIAAEELHKRLEEARSLPLDIGTGISEERAEELIRDIRAERDRHR